MSFWSNPLSAVTDVLSFAQTAAQNPLVAGGLQAFGVPTGAINMLGSGGPRGVTNVGSTSGNFSVTPTGNGQIVIDTNSGHSSDVPWLDQKMLGDSLPDNKTLLIIVGGVMLAKKMRWF